MLSLQNHGQLSYDHGQDTFNDEVNKALLKKMAQTKKILKKRLHSYISTRYD